MKRKAVEIGWVIVVYYCDIESSSFYCGLIIYERINCIWKYYQSN